jgi:sulfatase modifying factor 1
MPTGTACPLRPSGNTPPGGEHDPYYAYPWGDTIDGSQANYHRSGDAYETGPEPCTTPVGYYDGGQSPPGVDMANGYGLYDVAGNVWERCNDWYLQGYYSISPYHNPHGPTSASLEPWLFPVLRGGSWYGDATALRCALRSHGGEPENRASMIGFRIAAGA